MSYQLLHLLAFFFELLADVIDSISELGFYAVDVGLSLGLEVVEVPEPYLVLFLLVFFR